jgi:hypothetical protein
MDHFGLERIEALRLRRSNLGPGVGIRLDGWGLGPTLVAMEDRGEIAGGQPEVAVPLGMG